MKKTKKNRLYLSHVTSKGQTTIPKPVRDILGLEDGSEIAFKPMVDGILIVRVTTTVKEENPYTHAEWKIIERLAAEKGASFKSANAAVKHLRSL